MKKAILLIPLVLFVLVGCAPTMKDLPKLESKLSQVDEKERVSIVKDIGKIKDPQPTVLPILYKSLKNDKSPSVRAQAARSLANVKFPDATDAIKESLKADSDSDVRVAGVEALYSLSGNSSIDTVLASLKTDQSPAVRVADLKILQKIGGSKAREVIENALKNDPAPEVRVQAALSLGESKSESVLPLLSETAAKDSDANVRNECVKAIGKIPGAGSMGFLASALKDESLKDSAITAIYENHRGAESREVVTTLLPSVSSTDKIDARVLGILIDSRDERAKPVFMSYINYEYADGDTIGRIVTGLREAGDTTMVPNLVSRLGSEGRFPVQLNLCRALGYFGDRRAVPTLMSMLQARANSGNMLTPHLISALDSIGDPKAHALLCRIYCTDKEKSARDDAQSALASHPEWFNNNPQCAKLYPGCK